MPALLKERSRVTSAQSGKHGRGNEKRTNDPRASERSEIGGESVMDEVSPVRVLIADDHPLMVGGLREAVLAAAPDAEIAVAHDFESMVAALRGRQTPTSCCSI